MIEVITTKRNIVKYKCSCGVQGECMFKSPDKSTAMILDLKCPMCDTTKRLKLIKYNSEEVKKKLLEEDSELSWAIVVDNIVKGDV